MMMNIVAIEYGLAIDKGEIINAAEYEESQIFLNQAFSRYQDLAKKSPASESENSIAEFKRLEELVNSKSDPGEISVGVKRLNAAILDQFKVELKVEPTKPVSLDNGRKIYENRCVLCHGAEGNGDGPLAATLDPAPAVLSDPNITGDEHSNPYDNFQVINVGIANTGMIGWAEFLTEPEIWDVTFFIRTFSNANPVIPVVQGDAADNAAKGIEDTIQQTRDYLAQSLQLFKDGDTEAAAEMAFDAYMIYEGIEKGLTSKKKDLGLQLESSFSRYRAEIKRNASQDLIKSIYDGINVNLGEAQNVLIEKIGFTGLFLQSLSIIVREGFEAILIIAALITFLTKSRNADKLSAVYSGASIGILLSFVTAYILHEVLKISRVDQEIMEGWIMLVAVVALFWVSYWLVTKIEAAKWQSYITGKMRNAVSGGSLWALGMVAFLSVYREGFETVLFYKALYLYAGDETGGIVPGFVVGCLLLFVVYYLIGKLGMRIPVKWFFAVTSVFLYFMAFVFMGKGIHELQMGEQVSLTAAEFAPEISWLGMYPTWETFIGQAVLVLAYVFALLYTFVIKPEVETQQLQSETGKIQNDITLVHDLVEHISQHARRCEVFLKDTKDQDLKELSEHLKEIDDKVHELYDHVSAVENRFLNEFDRLAQSGLAVDEKKGLS
ncbi:MAG: c-type cytochrome [Candidatus Nitrohelix vancouverensis]|uniref:C-type cytochrome n=1 Tax=Candidatus Nitrohelix vancouverensis TaxID=2705534 RepID=A0A7T0C5A9_9BACT|nr:MAG: c-type cytochrome [Candidatus Nitrohelix vancouverensis]